MKTTLIALLVVLSAGGCGRDAGPRVRRETAAAPTPEVASMQTAATATPPTSASEATETAALSPGAMCLEHGVLEAVCTKCNPKLIPIFKAKGDWCAEHEFPESICPVCHPERGGRPKTDVSAEEPPADGTKIIFRTLETAREAGIRTVRAVPGPSAGDVTATAMIAADASRTARVNPRVGGVVLSIAADVGSRVSRGTALAVIESAALAESRSRLRAARARARSAEAAEAREKDLFDKGISSARELQAAEQELEAARADVASNEAALEMVGAVDDASGKYTLRSPIAGVVTGRDISIGALVESTDELFQVMDVSRLWAEIDVPEREASRVAPGQRVLLSVDGSDREFEGRIEFVSPVIDPATRTARARAALDNRDSALRANMYARARITVRPSESTILIPRESVQEARGQSLVFVRLAQDAFETRRVSVTPAGDDFFAVRQGLKGGEDVVTVGSFLLKTETLKESIGAGCCDVESPR